MGEPSLFPHDLFVFPDLIEENKENSTRFNGTLILSVKACAFCRPTT